MQLTPIPQADVEWVRWVQSTPLYTLKGQRVVMGEWDSCAFCDL